MHINKLFICVMALASVVYMPLGEAGENISAGLTPKQLVRGLIAKGVKIRLPEDICRGLGLPAPIDGLQIPTKGIAHTDAPGRNAALVLDEGKPVALLLIRFRSQRNGDDWEMDNWGFLANLKGQMMAATRVSGPSKNPTITPISSSANEVIQIYNNLVRDIAASRYIQRQLGY